MNTKNTIRKIFIVTIWVAIGSGMVTLLAAAMRHQKSGSCSAYIISIKGNTSKDFLNENDVLKILMEKAKGPLKGQQRSELDLMELERALEQSVWIRDAELYFDNKAVLHITVNEREPIARVFTLGGKTWYIDREEVSIPLSMNHSASVPVFTGFPVKKVVAKKDKELLHNVREIAEFINADPFWTAQVAQIDITPERQFEMIPAVGNHIVKLGDGTNYREKFNRLFIFYKKILAKTGFDKYKTIDVQFEGQVVATKGNTSKVDSVQLRRNVEKLLQLSRRIQSDTIMPVAPMIAKPSVEANTKPEIIEPPVTTPEKPVNPDPGASSPNPVKSFLKPKAVMPRRDG